MTGRLAIGVLFSLVLLASGCGTSAQAKKQHFLAQAGSICSHFSDLQNQVQFPSTNPIAKATTHRARAEWAVALKQVAYLGTQEVKALRKLQAPDPLAARFVALLRSKDLAYTHLLAAADAAKRNHVPALKTSVGAGRVALARAATSATQLGLRRCS